MSAESAAVHKAAGNAAYSRGDYDAAVAEFTQAIKFNANDPILYSNRSASYAAMKKGAEALGDAEQCLRLDPKFVKGYGRKGDALHLLGRYAEARTVYEQGLQLDPTNEKLKEGVRAVASSGSGPDLGSLFNSSATNKKLMEFAARNPKQFAELMEQLKKVKENPATLQNLLMNPDPKFREGLMACLGGGLGDGPNDRAPYEDDDAAFESPRYQQRADPCCGKGATCTAGAAPCGDSKTPPPLSQAEIHKNRGNEAYKKKDFDTAAQEYQKAMELEPEKLNYPYNLAAVHIERGDLAQAKQLCQDAIAKFDPIPGEFQIKGKIYARLGSIFEKEKDYGTAIEFYKTALVEFNDRHIRLALSECERLKAQADKDAYVNPALAEELRAKGNEYFKEGKFPDAKKTYDEAIKRNPSDPRAYANRAATYMKLYEMPSALADIDASLKIDPNVVKNHARKGLIHTHMKEYHKALDAYDAGLQLDPNNFECLQGRADVLAKIQQAHQSEKPDEDQLRHAMADPEIRALLREPEMATALNRLSSDPTALTEILRNPKLAKGIQKLMAAGVLRAG